MWLSCVMTRVGINPNEREEIVSIVQVGIYNQKKWNEVNGKLWPSTKMRNKESCWVRETFSTSLLPTRFWDCK